MVEVTTSRQLIFEKDYGSLFKWTEYLVFASVLVASLGIGLFYGFFSKKNKTNEDFLMAGRSMSIFPVSLSLICSFISAISILAEPVEVYFYGLIYIYFATAFIPMTLAVSYLYLPVFCKFNFTSAYEYFELRFNKTVRTIISIAAIIHLLCYMPVTVWAPSLAIDQVAGINKYWTSATIFIICVIYSSMGGLKAVLWSDALQAFVMFGTIISVLILGIKEVGGINVVWERAVETGRTNVLNFDFDPRTRHSFWTGTIAAFFSWLPLFAGTQAQIQRYLSVPGIKEARQCLFINMIGLFCVIGMSSLMGLMIFAMYYNCDPVSLEEKVVSSSDQLVPLFVMDVLGNYPGIPGLFVAGLTCGSLSSVSSALNALPAIIIEDYVKPLRPNYSDVKLGYLSKLISATGGLISFALIFIIAAAGNILPFTSLLHAVFLGPIVGIFSLGMFFPFSNSWGSILGAIPSLILTLFFGIGSILAGNAGDLPNQKLLVRTDGCYLNNTDSLFIDDIHLNYTTMKSSPAWKEEDTSGMIYVFSFSYLWQPAITVLSTIIFGLLFSAIINIYHRSPPVKLKYLTPLMVKLWVAILGKERLSSWIDFNDDNEDSKVKSNEILMVRKCVPENIPTIKISDKNT